MVSYWNHQVCVCLLEAVLRRRFVSPHLSCIFVSSRLFSMTHCVNGLPASLGHLLLLMQAIDTIAELHHQWVLLYWAKKFAARASARRSTSLLVESNQGLLALPRRARPTTTGLQRMMAHKNTMYVCYCSFKLFERSKGLGPAPGPLWLLVVCRVLARGQWMHMDMFPKVRGHAPGSK